MIDSADEFVRLRLSEVPDDYNRAANDEAPDDVWLEVIERFPDMKIWVAHNKKVSIQILKILSKDIDSEVRTTVASRRKLTTEIFELLAFDKIPQVRHSICRNPKVPQHILEALASDADSFVKKTAKEVLISRG